MVSNKTFNGDYKKNPFNFHHFNMNHFALFMDGEQVPMKALQPVFDATDGNYTLAYHTLFSGTGIHFSNSGNDISRYEYKGGYNLLAFDLTPDLSANECSHWNLVRNGNLRIEIGFSQALTESVNIIVYAELDNVIEMDRNRNVLVDFGS